MKPAKRGLSWLHNSLSYDSQLELINIILLPEIKVLKGVQRKQILDAWGEFGGKIGKI